PGGGGLGGRVRAVDGRARSAVATLARGAGPVQRSSRQTNQPALPRSESAGERKGEPVMSQIAIEPKKPTPNGHAAVSAAPPTSAAQATAPAVSSPESSSAAPETPQPARPPPRPRVIP